MCLTKCEEENEQIVILQGIGIALKTCIVFNIILKKIKLPISKLNLTNFARVYL
jgi:hypothetical protein